MVKELAPDQDSLVMGLFCLALRLTVNNDFGFPFKCALSTSIKLIHSSEVDKLEVSGIGLELGL